MEDLGYFTMALCWGSGPRCSHCHPLTDVPQVLTNENGGIATLSSLRGPMDVKSFYISNPSKVMHIAVRSADDCQCYRRGASPSRLQCCITIDSCVKSIHYRPVFLQNTPVTVTVTTVPPQSSPLVIELQADQGPTLTFPGLIGEHDRFLASAMNPTVQKDLCTAQSLG